MSNKNDRIAVAMSGGRDSTAVAMLLKEEGFAVVGLTARMRAAGSRCCPEEDIGSARACAAQLGIPHHVVDLRKEFEREIVDYFVREYVRGRTPSPCPLCNSSIKFGLLARAAREFGADRLATGHYARVTGSGDGAYRLFRGVATRKDQSYFLFALTQEQLARSVFPLGSMKKTDVSALVLAHGLPAGTRAESQDLCFVEPGQYAVFVEERLPGAKRRGDLVDLKGRKLGEHDGVHRFTIGQRRGLGVAAGEPLYVVHLDAERNVVTLGRKDDIMSHSLIASDVSWISGRRPVEDEIRLDVRIRYNHKASPAAVTLLDRDKVRIKFEAGQFAVTPGQCAVFYQDEEVMGGGWIEFPEDQI